MCIRDRLCAFVVGCLVGPVDRCLEASNELGSDQLVAFGLFGAVSYTHLRAHETVLDLVCRLLLAKKNTDC